MPPKTPKTPKARADDLLVSLGLAPTRSGAQALIMAGRVFREGGRPVLKAGESLPANAVLALSEGPRFVSRSGYKLEGALEELRVSPKGLACLDLGSSTGGFTDCLLQGGADRVTAVDVGRGLMDQKLSLHPKVKLVENQNARFLDQIPGEALGAPFDLAVMDLSFISLGLVLPQAARLLAPEGRILAMVKPQFEVGRGQVGKGGIVRNESLVKGAADKIASLGPSLDPPMIEAGRALARLKGRDGNQEVFILFARARP